MLADALGWLHPKAEGYYRKAKTAAVDAHDSWRDALQTQAAADPAQLARMRASLTAFLASRNLPADAPHTVIAGGAMYGHGLRPQFDDVDVLVPGLADAGRVDEPHAGLKVDAGREFRLGDREMTQAVMDAATRHPSGLNFMSPAHILEFKQFMNRPKDQADIATLQAHLAKTASTTPALQKLSYQYRAGADAALQHFNLKTAASVDELQAAFKRLAPLRVPPGVKTEGSIGIRAGAAGGGSAMLPLPALREKFRLRGLDLNQLLALATPEYRNAFKNIVGNIIIPRGAGGSTNAVRNSDGIATPASGAGRRAFNIAAGLHEGFERGLKPSEVAPVFTHASPKVLMNEHNMMSRMTGPGADEARAAFQHMRGISGETDALRTRLRDAYGARAENFLQPGARIPAALRRDLVRKMRQEALSIAPGDYQAWENFTNRMEAPKTVEP